MRRRLPFDLTRWKELIAVAAHGAPSLIFVCFDPFDYGHVGGVYEGVEHVIAPDGPSATRMRRDAFEFDLCAAIRFYFLPSLAHCVSDRKNVS